MNVPLAFNTTLPLEGPFDGLTLVSPVDGNVLTNDFDLEGDTQTVTTTTVMTTLGITVNIDPTTGAYTYTPLPNYVGNDSFVYTICDKGYRSVLA